MPGDPFQDQERMKFTGHERDLADPSGTGDDLDYMHARHCSPLLGRFLTTDPIRSAKLSAPQSWNLYTYALNNPINLIDSAGQEPEKPALAPKKPLHDVNRLVDQYGGSPNDWSKIRSSNFKAEDGTRFETHPYKKSEPARSLN